MHQDYLTKNEGGYCTHRYRFKTWPVVTSSGTSGSSGNDN